MPENITGFWDLNKEDWEKIHWLIADIIEEYSKAKSMLYVQKPLAYALYQVWKKYDAKNEERSNCDGGGPR